MIPVSVMVMEVVVHSFIQAISIAPPQVHCYSEALPTQLGYCVSKFHAEAPQATASEGLAQGPLVRLAFEWRNRNSTITITRSLCCG